MQSKILNQPRLALVQSRRRYRAIEYADEYDVVIVGGGIHGAALAWEAAHRGARTLLVERADFASSVSSNSMKTIHSGFQFMQSMNVGEMLAAAAECRTFRRIAPHLTRKLDCLVPISSRYGWGRIGSYCSVALYNLFTLFRNSGVPSTHKLCGASIGRAYTFLNLLRIIGRERDEIKGVVQWQDLQVNDTERFVLAFVQGAREAGATVANHVRLQNQKRDSLQNGFLLDLVDSLTGKQIATKASVLIDARGYWKYLHHPLPERQYSKGVNLVLGRKFATEAVGIRLKEEDRLVFLVPWHGQTLIGTWYFAHALGARVNTVSESEIAMCIKQLNEMLPANMAVSSSDIVDIHCGLLPCRHDNDVTDKQRVQHTGFTIEEEHGYYFVQGTKYTTARRVAQQVLDRIHKHGQIQLRPSLSAKKRLPGAINDTEMFSQTLCLDYEPLRLDQAKVLVKRYGEKAEEVLVLIDAGEWEEIPGLIGFYAAEIQYALEYEYAETLSDVLIRRFGLRSYGPLDFHSVHFCAERMAFLSGWSDQVFFQQVREYYANYPLHRHRV